MARQRLRAAALKAAERALEARRSAYEPNVIADGVRAVAVEFEDAVTAGSLYWQAPFRYVIEQMAPLLCRVRGLPAERAPDVGEYLLAAFNEYVVALVEGFDVEHFEAWIAAQNLQVERWEAQQG